MFHVFFHFIIIIKYFIIIVIYYNFFTNNKFELRTTIFSDLKTSLRVFCKDKICRIQRKASSTAFTDEKCIVPCSLNLSKLNLKKQRIQNILNSNEEKVQKQNLDKK
jgi:hypothetical protein